jgi:hypothetical protein
MEYVEGENLQQILDRDGAIPFAIASEYIAQAAAGLQHAHEKQFVHRDIKPGNLMRDKSGVVKILDMGLARSSSDRDKLTEQLDQGAVVGTADFIAPEQAMNNAVVDGRADIYSLGATFFSLIIGKPPFSGNTTQKLLQHQLKSAPTLASLDSTLPKGLSAVVAKMLAKNPDQRYQTPAEVIAALAPWTAGNSRILAGLSRTNLGQGADLHAALQERGTGSSLRLNSDSPVLLDSGVIDTAEPQKDTAAVSTSQTVRNPKRDPLPQQPRRRTGVYAALAVAVLAVAGVGAWFAFASPKTPVVAEKPAPEPEPQPQPKQPDDKQPQPPVEPKKPNNPEPPPPKDRTLFSANFATQQPFVMRCNLTPDAKDPKRLNYTVLSQTGPGKLPTNWQARPWNKDTEMETFAEVANGSACIGTRNARGPGSSMLFSPLFDCTTGHCELQFEYAANVRAKGFTVRFKPKDQRGAWDVIIPAVGGTQWRSETVTVDLKGASGGFFEFHNVDASPNAALRLRAMTVKEQIARDQDRVVFKLDATDLPGFRTTKLGQKKTGGEDMPTIQGVAFGAYKAESESEWVCGPIGDAKAIGFTNLNDVNSTQIAIEMEKQTGLKFAPGQLIRVRVTYRTTGKGRGNLYCQTYDDWKVSDRVNLPNSNTEWKTVELLATRGENPLRCLVDTSESGTGNTIYVKSITIAEVTP